MLLEPVLPAQFSRRPNRVSSAKGVKRMEAYACTVPIECDGGHTEGQAAARTADRHSRGGAGPRAEVLRASLPNPGPAEPDDPDGYYRRVCALFFFSFLFP